MINVKSRRLSAILATDIVGYSTLLEKDEAGTLTGLHELRTDILEPKIFAHDGQIVKNMGDGWLVEFSSTVDAVNCAAQLQEALVGHQLIRLRIGVHVGEIVHQNEDIFGEGVNVAARLEQLAEPGSVLISDVAHGFIDRKTDYEFKNLGKHKLKNISKEQLIFGWAPEAAKCASLIVQTVKKVKKDEDIVQILLINELTTMGSNEKTAEIAEELQYELKLVLSRRAGLKVVTEQRGGLSPNYVLGGRVRVSGENLRIDIEICDGASGASIWVERFTSVIDEMDNLITSVRNKVSGFVRNMTNTFSGSRYSDIPDRDLSLGELLSKSAHLIQRWDQQSVSIARNSLELAVKLAPENPMALAMLASTFAVPMYAGYGSTDETESQRAIEIANKAVNIGRNIDFVFQARALVKCFLLRDLAGALADCERAIKINPYFHILHSFVAMIEIINGNPDTGIEQLHEWIRTVPDDPNVPIVYSFIALGHLICEENDKALQFAREGYEFRPLLPICAVVYAAAASNSPEIINSENFKTMIHQLDLRTSTIKNLPFARAEDSELITSRLRAAGVSD
jgi:adenylate cyclase